MSQEGQWLLRVLADIHHDSMYLPSHSDQDAAGLRQPIQLVPCGREDLHIP